MRWQTRKAFHFDLKAHGEIILDGGAVTTQTPIKKSKISMVLDILTLSEANGLTSRKRFYKSGKPKPEHWTEKHERHKKQKRIVFYNLNPHRANLLLPCTVRMARLAPRQLDEEDNLRIALKWVKDAIAEVITQDFVPGRADGDKRIKWEYDQEFSSEYKVKIEIW